MSKIGNIYLIWRKGPGSRRIVVGRIKKNSSQGTVFEYIQENLGVAERQGFFSYTGFPDVKKVYTENVIDIFSQRLSKSERNDLKDFYNFWKVDLSKKTDFYYMLSQTQGILPIDNFEFLADFNPYEGLVFISEIAGLTNAKISSDLISVGDTLDYKLNPNNQYDEYSVEVYKNSMLLGHVKRIHSKVFYKTKHRFTLKVHHIEKNTGTLKRVFIEIKI